MSIWLHFVKFYTEGGFFMNIITFWGITAIVLFIERYYVIWLSKTKKMSKIQLDNLGNSILEESQKSISYKEMKEQLTKSIYTNYENIPKHPKEINSLTTENQLKESLAIDDLNNEIVHKTKLQDKVDPDLLTYQTISSYYILMEEERRMENYIRDEYERLNDRVDWLYQLANLSTLTGLLGTVFGLITAFASTSAADPSQKGILLSIGISNAMNTTAFGLVIALPCLAIFQLFCWKIDKRIHKLEKSL